MIERRSRSTVDPRSSIGDACEPGTGTGGGLNRSTVTSFDEAGRSSEVTDPLGHSVETVYDERGLVAQTTDASEGTAARRGDI